MKNIKTFKTYVESFDPKILESKEQKRIPKRKKKISNRTKFDSELSVLMAKKRLK